MTEQKDQPAVVAASPEEVELQERQRQLLDGFWAAAERIGNRNADKDPNEVLRDVTAAVEEVRPDDVRHRLAIDPTAPLHHYSRYSKKWSGKIGGDERKEPRSRVVVSSDLLVGGTIGGDSESRALIRAWSEQRFVLLLSDDQRAELTAVFSRPQIVQGYGLTPEELSHLVSGLVAAERIDPRPTGPLDVGAFGVSQMLGVGDGKAARLLAAVHGGDADRLVTEDEELLWLRGRGYPIGGVPEITNVRTFLLNFREHPGTLREQTQAFAASLLVTWKQWLEEDEEEETGDPEAGPSDPARP